VASDTPLARCHGLLDAVKWDLTMTAQSRRWKGADRKIGAGRQPAGGGAFSLPSWKLVFDGDGILHATDIPHGRIFPHGSGRPLGPLRSCSCRRTEPASEKA
jgi:hypothetical protein